MKHCNSNRQIKLCLIQTVLFVLSVLSLERWFTFHCLSSVIIIWKLKWCCLLIVQSFTLRWKFCNTTNSLTTSIFHFIYRHKHATTRISWQSIIYILILSGTVILKDNILCGQSLNSILKLEFHKTLAQSVYITDDVNSVTDSNPFWNGSFGFVRFHTDVILTWSVTTRRTRSTLADPDL